MSLPHYLKRAGIRIYEVHHSNVIHLLMTSWLFEVNRLGVFIVASACVAGMLELPVESTPWSRRVDNLCGVFTVLCTVHWMFFPVQRTPFISALFSVVPRAAVAEGLLESELFGHEHGSFSGAIRRHIGKFEQAHHGTLFLDETGEASLAFQAKLLCAIETRCIDRVGGRQSVPLSIRIVAATNQAADVLLQYDWPGNVRELRNLIQRGAVHAGTAVVIEAEHLRPELRDCVEQLRTLHETREQATGSACKAALDRTNGSKAAALLLNVHRSTVHRQIKKQPL